MINKISYGKLPNSYEEHVNFMTRLTQVKIKGESI